MKSDPDEADQAVRRSRPEGSEAGSTESTAHDPADRYRALFENSADAILIIEDDTFIDCNAAAVEMLRCRDKAAVMQTHPSELSPEFQPDGRRSFEKANEMMAIAFERGSHRFEWDHVRADGEVFPVEVLLTAVPRDGGHALHTVWRDITDRKRLENELRHAHKMEAVGKLAGGIAHDFNNQLVGILGFAELLASQLQDRPDLLEHVLEIDRAGSRAASLVKQLLVFSHKQVSQPAVVDLDATVGGLMGMLRHLIGEDVELVLESLHQQLPVRIDPGEVEQIVLNLAANARDAMPRGGTLTLALSRSHEEAGETARLEISDTGVGMDPDTLARAFDPFFSTKGLGRGTGLGLSTVYGLVTRAGGKITARSELGRGATFEVVLPLDGEELDEASAPSAPTGEPARREGHILVVEDEPIVARLTREVLGAAGYRISERRNGKEALELLRRQEFDLVLSDVIMSKMSGPEMVKELRALGRSQRVLFMSGYTDDRLAAHGFDPENVPLLRKPFTASALLESVRVALAIE
ncbi:MAG: response regulator [Deltaproteobacteria bacterium]|nr:response regulator [Deltaproteobacteria bacterium]